MQRFLELCYNAIAINSTTKKHMIGDGTLAGAAVEAAACILVGVAGGLLFGVFHLSMETTWFNLLKFLETRGHVRRLSDSIEITRVTPTREDFMAVSISPMPLAGLMWAARGTYYRHCHVSFSDVAAGLALTWTLMVLHDAYFWAVHTAMHRVKAMYRRFHQLHHSTGGNISVYSTAYGEVADVAISITPFYALVMLWVYVRGRPWNPVHFGMAAWAVNNVDMMGHCGYHLPAFVYVPASLGVLLTPLAQRPLHHYIHHLDPRCNRSLYFTWWDRLAGTYSDTHPKLSSP